MIYSILTKVHNSLANMLRDFRYSLRILSRTPGFTIGAVVILGLGISATTVCFGLLESVILADFPVANPDDLVSMYGFDLSRGFTPISYPDYEDYRKHSDVFEGLAAYVRLQLHVRTHAGPKRLLGELVTENYFSILGIQPEIGRPFLDAHPGGDATPVAVISHDLWQGLFGSDTTIIGKTVGIGGHSFTIIGVAPRGFRGIVQDWGGPPDLWIPLTHIELAHRIFWEKTKFRQNRQIRVFLACGRLKTGISLAQAQTTLETISKSLEHTHPHTNTRQTIKLVPIGHARFWPTQRGAIMRFSLLLMGVGVFVLILASSNVAGLLLIRAASRSKETAVRLALGCSEVRLAQQLLAETLILCLAGGLLALILTQWTSSILDVLPGIFGRTTSAHGSITTRVVVVALIISGVAAIALASVPLLQAHRSSLRETLQQQSYSIGGPPRNLRWRDLLIVLQVGMTCLLLLCSALILKSLHNARSTELGFDPRNILLVSVDLASKGYGNLEAKSFYIGVKDVVDRLPGVVTSSWTNGVPLVPPFMPLSVTPQGDDESSGIKNLQLTANVVSPDYFRTLGIPVLQGRSFLGSDGAGRNVVIVNEACAETLFPSRNALGRSLRLGNDGSVGEIVGIVSTIKYKNLGEDPMPYLYIPLYQKHEPGDLTLQVRTTGEPTGMVSAVAGEIERFDKNLVLYDVRTMEEATEKGLAKAEGFFWSMVLAASFGLLLAFAGIYGSVSFRTSQRIREIAIRLAVGARRRDVAWRVMKTTVYLSLLGVASGIVTAILLTRLLGSILFGVSPTDPISFFAVTLFLVIATLFAGYLPVRSSVRQNLARALRYE